METVFTYQGKDIVKASNDTKRLSGRMLREDIVDGETYLAFRWTGCGVATYRVLSSRPAGGGVGTIYNLLPIHKGL